MPVTSPQFSLLLGDALLNYRPSKMWKLFEKSLPIEVQGLAKPDAQDQVRWVWFLYSFGRVK